MRKNIVSLLVAGGLAVASGTAAARVDVGISLGFPAPVYVQPAPVYYAPRPVYVPPPVYYAPAPVYYSEPVYYYGPPRHRRHHRHYWR